MSGWSVVRWTGVLGLAAIVVQVVAVVIGSAAGSAPAIDDATKLLAYVRNSHFAATTVLMLFFIGFALFLGFSGGLRAIAVAANPEHEWLATTTFGAGVVIARNRLRGSRGGPHSAGHRGEQSRRRGPGSPFVRGRTRPWRGSLARAGCLLPRCGRVAGRGDQGPPALAGPGGLDRLDPCLHRRFLGIRDERPGSILGGKWDRHRFGVSALLDLDARRLGRLPSAEVKRTCVRLATGGLGMGEGVGCAFRPISSRRSKR
jgi:hypothetical protein